MGESYKVFDDGVILGEVIYFRTCKKTQRQGDEFFQERDLKFNKTMEEL